MCVYAIHESDKGEGKFYLRRDIPVRGLRVLNVNHHGKVPACSSVYIYYYTRNSRSLYWKVVLKYMDSYIGIFRWLHPRCGK